MRLSNVEGEKQLTWLCCQQTVLRRRAVHGYGLLTASSEGYWKLEIVSFLMRLPVHYIPPNMRGSPDCFF